MLEKMDHPCIVKYREVIRNSPKLVTIVMEFCGGGDVSEKIARRKFRNQYFDEPTIKYWFVQTTDAINYLRLKGILHRDIKTANLFLSATGEIKLGDFGGLHAAAEAVSLERNAPHAVVPHGVVAHDSCLLSAIFSRTGIARVLDRNAALPSERTARTPVGTPMFMAPEICGGHRYGV